MTKTMSPEFTTQALTEIYRAEFTNQVSRLASYCFDRGTAEEILQDSYTKAISAGSTFKSKDHFISWLHTVARNQAISFYRKQKRSVEFDDLAASSLIAPNHEEAQVTETRHQAVAVAISDLDDSTRGQVVRRFYQQGKKVQQIGAELSMSTNTVLSHLHRFRSHLKLALDC